MYSSTPQVKRQTARGFTLIETLIAIVILIAAITGPLTLATKSLFASFVARDQLVASFLAQDAVEYVRFKRDSNFRSGDDWLSGDLALCISPSSCEVDSVADTVTACDSECTNLLRNEQGFYGYTSGDVTMFNRSVTLIPVVGNSEEYIVDVILSWKTGIFTRSHTTKEHIYNWLQ
ncbi:MAG TPA: prepilin-type N-terminal cleavage/methylation domain-containing protein [Candidatus Paceibacterota bacterium]